MMTRINRPSTAPRNTNNPPLSGLMQACLLAASIVALGTARAADGDPDPSFGSAGVNYVEWAGGPAADARLGVGNDGKVYVGATINRTGNNRDFAITRLLADGGLDTSFGFLGYRSVAFDYVPNGYDSLRGVFPLPDGKLMLLGNAEVSGEIVARAPPAMVRLTAIGNIDTSFGNAGKLSIGADMSPWPNGSLYLRGVARQPDGKFLFGGYCNSCIDTYSAVVLRVDGNGIPDSSFGQNGWARVTTPQPSALWSLAIDRQDRIVLAGNVVESGAHRPMIVRFTSSGLADATFGGGDAVALVTLANGAEINWGATGIAIDRDNALLLSVASYLPLAVSRTGVIRVFPTGSLHLNYGVSGLRDLTNDDGSKIYAVAMRSDRRLVAAGYIRHEGGNDFYVARTLPNGNLDNTFAGNGVARYALSTSQDDAESIVLSAGKPIIAGKTYVGGSVGVSVLRLQSDLIFTDGVD